MTTVNRYGADSTTILEGLDVVDNAVDEAISGHATLVEVRLLADGGV